MKVLSYQELYEHCIHAFNTELNIYYESRNPQYILLAYAYIDLLSDLDIINWDEFRQLEEQINEAKNSKMED